MRRGPRPGTPATREPCRPAQPVGGSAAAPRIDRLDRPTWARPITSGQVLSTLARDAIDLFAGPLAGRIRRCAGVNCTLLFADTSRPGQRRWCSMQRCGNRAKAREFRQRKEQAR